MDAIKASFKTLYDTSLTTETLQRYWKHEKYVKALATELQNITEDAKRATLTSAYALRADTCASSIENRFAAYTPKDVVVFIDAVGTILGACRLDRLVLQGS